MRISDWSSDVCSSDLTAASRWAEPPDPAPPPSLRTGGQHVLVQLGDIGGIGADLLVGARAVLGRLGDAGGNHDRRRLVRDHRQPRLLQSAENVLALLAEPLERGVEHRRVAPRSEEHTSELQSLMRTSYAVFCLKK